MVRITACMASDGDVFQEREYIQGLNSFTVMFTLDPLSWSTWRTPRTYNGHTGVYFGSLRENRGELSIN